MPEAHGDNSAGPLAEFVALRQEIDRRSIAQQAILVLQVSATGAVAGLVLRDPGKALVLLVLPLAGFAFCAIYLDNAFQIIRIGNYIKDVLSDKVPGGLHWEKSSRVIEKWEHKIVWPVSLFAMFPLVATAALIWSAHRVFIGAITASTQAGPIAAWAFGLLATVAMTILIAALVFEKEPRRTRTVGGAVKRTVT